MKRENLYIRVPPQKTDGTYDFIKSLGGDPEKIARAANMYINANNSEIRYHPWKNLCRFFELTAEDLEDPYFGLKWALNIPSDLRNIGPTIFLGTIADNLRHFVETFIKHMKVYTNGVVFSYEDDFEQDNVIGHIDIHPLSPTCRQYCEHLMATIAVMGRRYVPDFKLNFVTFQYSAPDDIAWYEKAFECPVHFNADYNTMVLDSSYFGSNRTPAAVKFGTTLLDSYLNWANSKNPTTSEPITHLIMESLPALLGVNKSDINSVGEALQLHPKKLQRLLAEEGRNYSEILDDVRMNIAKRLLKETDISVDRIAKVLDYSSNRAFTAASKRWFEISPNKYRKTLR